MTKIDVHTKWAREWWMTDSAGRPLPIIPGLTERSFLSYGFKATRKKGSTHVHVEPVEEYPRALSKDVEVRRDKYGNYSCLFMYEYRGDAERERQAMAELEVLFRLDQKKLYDMYKEAWSTMKRITEPFFKREYLYKLTFPRNVHKNLMQKKAKVTPERLLRILQANKEITKFIANLSNFNESNCPYDYSLGRKTPL